MAFVAVGVAAFVVAGSLRVSLGVEVSWRGIVDWRELVGWRGTVDWRELVGRREIVDW